MGFVVGIICLAVNYLLYHFWGFSLWAIVPMIIIWVLGWYYVVLTGHRAFATGVNTDLNLYILVIAIGCSIFLPKIQESNEEKKIHSSSDTGDYHTVQ